MTPRPRARAGFTLAEVAVTLAIVAIALLWVLQGLHGAKLAAAHTHSQKIATELGLQTLGRVESGLFWEESGDLVQGTFAEEGYPEFQWTVALGDESFPEEDVRYGDGRRTDLYRRDRDEDDDAERAEQPYERVRVRVAFHPFTEQPGEVVLERWVPWHQVHGSRDEALGGGR